MMIFRKIRDWQFQRRVVNGLYQMAMAQARTVTPYTEWDVPDTITGRMNMISLFVVFYMYHLNRSAKAQNISAKQAQKMTQKLYNLMEQDLEAALRRMGVGDDGVLHRIRKASSSFYGDYFALTPILSETEGFADFQEVIKRNIYATYLEPDTEKDLSTTKLTAFSQWAWACHQQLLSENYASLCDKALSNAQDFYKP